MRVHASAEKRDVLAVSGKHTIVLMMRWPKAEHKELLGFAIRRTGPDGLQDWLKTALQFGEKKVTKGALYGSDVAPIQSMTWVDTGLNDDKTKIGLPAGSEFAYDVFAVRGTSGQPEIQTDQTVQIVISTEAETDKGPDQPEVHFNRGLSAMQEYERLFGEGHQPDDDPTALAWLARDLEGQIVGFIGEVVADASLRLDVAAYHLDAPTVLGALEKLGDRLRISLDWGPEERGEKPGPNAPAYERLIKAGASVHQREHVSISHNKYMVIKDADGAGRAVLTGSTNFTSGGISTQSNQSVIVRNPDLATAYLKDFERVLKDDNLGLRSANEAGTIAGKTLEVFFSPHSAQDRPDLDRLAALAANATSSRLFMTFRMTDSELITAMMKDNVPVFGVADRAYRGNDDSGDRLIFDEAHSPAPRIAACNKPLDDEPDEGTLLRELKREGYNPIVHHKILLLDWDTPQSVVVTGSANYSTNSTQHNDENSLIIHGDARLAEEYFVEFCRLFTHWYPRWLRERNAHVEKGSEHLLGDGHWTDIWAGGGRMAEFHAAAFRSVQNKANAG